MRILMLTDFYPPGIGGMEQHVRNLSLALMARGHAVSVATLWNEGRAEFEEDHGIRVYRIRGTVHRTVRLVFSNPSQTYAPPVPDPELLGAIRRLILDERPDVVHGHDWLVRSFIPLKAWSGARLVVSLHYYNLACAKKTLIYHDAPCSGPGFTKCISCAVGHYGAARGLPTVFGNWTMGAAERAAVDMYLPVSQAVAEGNGLVGSRFPYRVLPNFVPDDLGALPDSRDGPEGRDSCLRELPRDGYLLFVGALRRYKGVETLLRAYQGLAGAPPLVLIGPVWPETPTEVPPNVKLLRNWRHDAVMHAWRRSLIGLAPSIWPEPCPTVVMEAMAAGRPVVASRIGGIPDLVADGQTGFLVPPDDPVALRRAMQRLLADAALRDRMGQAGYQKLAGFRASAVVPRIEAVYREAI
ncbi:MAG: glycosyltransferase family 4 protein, partial [Chloroflexota bacterium]